MEKYQFKDPVKDSGVTGWGDRASSQKEVTVVETHAHGRVNLIGDHTDYNGGWVLITAVPQATYAVLKPRGDRLVQVDSVVEDDTSSLQWKTEYEFGEERRHKSWVDYIQGITALLTREGHKIRGFELSLRSTVPIGSGFSSGATLEMSAIKAIREAFNLDLTDAQIAKYGQRVQNEFVGGSGCIVDQVAANLVRLNEAILIDTADLSYERIVLPLDKMDLVVINSGITHELHSGEFQQRKSECAMACQLLNIPSLRYLSGEELNKITSLPQPFQRRVRHVVSENARVHGAVMALRNGNVEALGRLFYLSHLSLRDDYQVSIPEIDALVEIAMAQPGVHGARMTGTGFGGSIVAVADEGRGLEAAQNIVDSYERQIGKHATILLP